MSIVATIIGKERTMARLQRLVPLIRPRLKEVIEALAWKLAGRIQQNRLSGQSLHVRTGTLRRSIKGKVEDTSAGLYGVAYTNVEYAGIHEYGFNGNVSVKAHLRTIKEAFGRSISPTQVNVREHQRHVVMPQRAFMRPELETMLPEIRKTLSEEMDRAVDEYWEQSR